MNGHRSTPVVLLLALLVTVAALAVVPTAAAQSPVQITLQAGEGSDCSGGKAMCFLVTEGNLADLTPGAQVQLTFIDPAGHGVHNVHVTTWAQADHSHGDTPTGVAFAHTGNLSGGERETINFTIPSSAKDVYIWCDMPSHEANGMWLTTASTSQKPSPGFTTVGAVAALGAALVLLSRRRR